MRTAERSSDHRAAPLSSEINMSANAYPLPLMSALAPKPPHVPDNLVYDFDLLADPALLRDGHARILEIAKTAPPIFWTQRQGGHWVLAGHEAVFEGARDWEIFSSELRPHSEIQGLLAMLPPGTPHIPLPLPITVDPPLHGVYRLPLNTAFSPKAMNGLKGSIRELAQS